jgi:hypothetical protein
MPADDEPNGSSPLDRRQFLVAGGVTATLATILVACSSSNTAIPVSGSIAQPATLTQPPVNNAVYLRTSSSVVRNAMNSYDTLLGLKVLSAADTTLVEFIRGQHVQHSEALQAATRVAGGEPYSGANPNVTETIVAPAFDAMKRTGNKPDDVLRYVNAFESFIAATLQQFVPLVSDASPRELMMRISSSDNRHSAVVTSRIGGFTILPPLAVQTNDTTTTTTSTTTTTIASPSGSEVLPPVAPLPVAQIPAAFASLAAIEVVLGGRDLTWETPGPNSYIYEPQPPTTTG